ncbi:MAG: sulfotransferase family protein [Patescibacteria group bacterium]
MTASKPHINFIGVGAARSGTTWLAKCLDEHPSICVSRPKEVNFFNETYPFYRQEDSTNYPRGLSWYEKHFNHCSKDSLKGEFSVIYLADEQAPRRIKETYPECKIIICLRNPIDKVLSHIALKKSHTFQIIGNSPDEIISNHPELIKNGLYSEHIKRYIDVFGKSSVHIILFDDIKNHPDLVFKKVVDFIGAPVVDTVPSLNKTINASKTKQGIIRSILMRVLRFMKKFPFTQTLLHWLKHTNIFYKLEHAVEYIDIQKKQKSSLVISTDTRAKWYNQYFADDVEQIEALLDIDLDTWKQH